ncbi:peptide deformylase [Thioclava sp. FR2]|uniref:peptide deformylase n=1 Tax=Thioclava sp. FR2 TaxID=3445780 RepID=UPI003EB9D7F9
MAVLPIVFWPDARLSTRCEAVDPRDPSVAQLAHDMLETMYAAPGRGLAAPQVGVAKRVFVMDIGWKEGPKAPVICVNPRILWRSDTAATGPEGCLSIPEVVTDVARATEIRLAWTDLSGAEHEEHLTGFAAICAQHEYDHLEGIVTFDRLGLEARRMAEAVYADRTRT